MAQLGVGLGDDLVQKLPLVAVRDQVIFPGVVMTLMVSRAATQLALDSAVEGDQLVFVSLQRSSAVEHPKASDLHSIGVISEVLHVVPLPDGSSRAVLRGQFRARMTELGDGFASCEKLTEDASSGSEIVASRRLITEGFGNLASTHRLIPPESLESVMQANTASQFADAVAYFLPCEPTVKQKLLAETRIEARLSQLVRLVRAEENLLKIEQTIRDQVDQELGDSQREFILRKQLKAIQSELLIDDSVTRDFEELTRRIDALALEGSFGSSLRAELQRLMRADPDSAEYQSIRNYLETALDLPWHASAGLEVALEGAKELFDRRHFGIEEVKENLIEILAEIKLRGTSRGTVLCFVGPPGVGKTSVAQTFAEILGRPAVSIALGGLRDDAEIRGHRRTYVGSRLGRILTALRSAKVRNPVCILDEIDKMQEGPQGSPAGALLEVLDSQQNSSFVDHFLEVPFDLSEVTFIATANSLEKLPAALLDRMEIIEFSGYSSQERCAIALNHVLPAVAAESGLGTRLPPFTEEALALLANGYTRESGVRGLTRITKRLARKLAVQVAAGSELPAILDVADIEKLLGPPILETQSAMVSQIGSTHGLVVSSYGGDRILIEVSLTRPVGAEPKLTLTGALGPVMQESVQTALTCVRSMLDARQVDSRFDVHVHLPQAAIPKDGPSAGVTVGVALHSAFTGRMVRGDVAMTGEITLRGQLIAIGGLREKVLAAKRYGYAVVLYPAEQASEAARLGEEEREGIELRPVQTLSEAIEIASAYAQTVNIL